MPRVGLERRPRGKPRVCLGLGCTPRGRLRVGLGGRPRGRPRGKAYGVGLG